MKTISSVSSPKPKIVIVEPASNDPKTPSGCGRQEPTVPPSLNNLNLPQKSLNIPATKTTVQPAARQCNKRTASSHWSRQNRLNFRRPRQTLAHWRLGDFFRRRNLHFGGEPRQSLSFFLSLSSTATQETKKGIRHGDILFTKRGNVAACLRSLRTNTPWSKRNLDPFHNLKLDWRHTDCYVFMYFACN